MNVQINHALRSRPLTIRISSNYANFFYSIDLEVWVFILTSCPCGIFPRFSLGPVRTYPNIFESATFTFRIINLPRPHAAYSNRIHLSTRIRWCTQIHSRETRPIRCATISTSHPGSLILPPPGASEGAVRWEILGTRLVFYYECRSLIGFATHYLYTVVDSE